MPASRAVCSANVFSLFFVIFSAQTSHPVISECIKPIFTKFSQHDRKSDFKRFSGNDLSTSCENVVNFGAVTSEFKRLTRVHPSSISSLAMFTWRCHC